MPAMMDNAYLVTIAELRAEIERLRAALAEERERCVGILEQMARALLCGRRRANEVDRHTADVLMNAARRIRLTPQGEQRRRE